jgi:hypothetical protein
LAALPGNASVNTPFQLLEDCFLCGRCRGYIAPVTNITEQSFYVNAATFKSVVNQEYRRSACEDVKCDERSLCATCDSE